MSTVFITHPACRRHQMGPDHPECPQRLDVITDMLMTLRVLDLLAHSEPPAVSREELLRVHDARYLDRLERILPEKGYATIDLDTRMCPLTLKAARYAAGSVVQAVNQVMAGGAKNAFCAARPPGHHATRDAAMGFCFYNNVAIGAAHAIAEYDVERVAIVDFDVHHGNGTDEIFKDDERVKLFSLYETDLFPLERGEEPEGSGIYIPLAAGSGSEALRAAVEETWLPALNAFEPQLLMISAGFDAHVQDDMSSLAFTDADFHWLSRVCLDIAERHAGGRLVSVLEGGYDLESLARCAAQHVKLLANL